MLGLLGSYLLPAGLGLRIALAMLLVGASGGLVIAATITAESFPTEQRGDGMAWTNGLLGRFGFVLSPLIVSGFAEVYGWPQTMPYLAVLPLIALLTVWWFAPPPVSKGFRGGGDFDSL